MGLDSIQRHPLSSSRQHAEINDDPIVASAGVVIKSHHIVFEYPARIGGELR